MGAYSPAPVVTPDVEARVHREIFEPLLAGLRGEGIVFRGILYAGLMIERGVPGSSSSTSASATPRRSRSSFA